MKHLGDISKINGAHIEPVDLITFGSPCQDLSVAGKRAGMKHEANGDGETTRSGLFMEAVRIIKEMREATNGKYPRFILFENVPGIFSSNKGEDFRIVLEEIIQIIEPEATMPAVPKAGWAYADCYSGNGWSLAYRILDAQYIRTAQRRRRLYLIADFGGERAKEILFKRESLRGDYAKGKPPWQRTSAYVEGGVETADSPGEEKRVRCLNPWDTQGIRQYDANGLFPTLPAGSRGGQNRSGVVVCAGFKAGQSTGGIGYQVECAATISAEGSATEPTVVYSIGNGQSNQSFTPEKAGALNCMHDQQAIVFDKEVYQSGINAQGGHYIAEGGPAPALRTTGHPPGVCVAGVDCRNGRLNGDLSGTLQAKENGGISHNCIHPVIIKEPTKYVVRRLTPTECARLQGFPDGWGKIYPKTTFTPDEYSFWLGVRKTHAEINGKQVRDYTQAQMLAWYNKLHTDSAEYKMWGNGIALPTALYCMQGIAEVLHESRHKRPHSTEGLSPSVDNSAV